MMNRFLRTCSGILHSQCEVFIVNKIVTNTDLMRQEQCRR